MRNKFNPKDVPSWCKWIAVDEDGDYYCYDSKPIKEYGVFGGYWNGSETREAKQTYLYEGKKPKNWKDELYTWGY